MKNLKFLAAAFVAVIMSSCVQFKTEATVDVEVTRKGKPLAGETVYKIKDIGLGEGTANYKQNASGSAVSNAAGIAHFDIKSPDDIAPGKVMNVDVQDSETFYFVTFDAEGTRNALVTVRVKSGDKLTVQLEVPEGLVNGSDE